MKVHARKAIFVILLVSVIASVSSIFFSNQALLYPNDNTSLPSMRPGNLFSVYAQDSSGDEEDEDEENEEDEEE